MKLFIACLMIGCLFISCADTSMKEKTKGVPESWGKDFTISLYTGGGMLNESSKVEYTHDSCVHIEQKNEEIKRKGFALTEADRSTILNRLRELSFYDIKEDTTHHAIIYDKETVNICMYNAEEFCVSEGSIAETDKKGMEHFSAAYRFLFDFAGSK